MAALARLPVLNNNVLICLPGARVDASRFKMEVYQSSGTELHIEALEVSAKTNSYG
jgi:hypothetical protein